ncbi:enoyl-CoA hydratase/isomerase family protein, partial [Flavobacteriaceae bacterium]|nr:enoyl-CoA hydratase/isomerase family protein [Flavobacteriaceae bacterium]
MDKAVLVEIEGSVAIITLNRPERYNAVNQDLLDGFNESFSIVENDDSVRAVILTGKGKGFCAGADMSTFGLITPEQSRDYIIEKYKPLMKRFLALKKPIIGAINGSAAGVGAAFALACDFRVMSKESSILYAFINIGLGPDGGASWLLSRQVGYSKALEIASNGKKVLGEECLS